ncbi:MAG: hypothetical protein IT294_09940, partial [Deltaproteobacteria bacterium]|nr:hypothetical protein [Deltaproteobacteria bacterium]
MLSRRTLIGKVAVGAAAALVVGAARTGAAAATRPPDGGAADVPTDGTDAAALERSAAPEAERPEAEGEAAAPWEWLAPLSAGAVVGHGWSLGELTPVRDGSAVVTLRNARGH